MRAVLALLILGVPAVVSAQSSWTYRARISAESTSSQANGSSPLNRASNTTWHTQELFAASADGAWNPSDRLRAAGGVVVTASEHAGVDARVRELYVRAAATSWLDLEAGKRLLRWGVGYGFSPAGVLDPPRIATDPSDRLQLNDGRLLARADLFRGDSALSLAVGSELAAARLSTVTRGGVELALIAAAGPGRRPEYGGTLTHVVGDRLEWHTEALLHEDLGARVISATAGLQYTFPAGVNLVVEYHRNGRGLNGPEWNAVLNRQRSPGERPSRQNFLFLRAARTAADQKVSPELIVITGIDDNGWTIVPSVTWTPHRHIQMHMRVTRLAGSSRSIARAAPFATLMTAGATVRF